MWMMMLMCMAWRRNALGDDRKVHRGDPKLGGTSPLVSRRRLSQLLFAFNFLIFFF